MPSSLLFCSGCHFAVSTKKKHRTQLLRSITSLSTSKKKCVCGNQLPIMNFITSMTLAHFWGNKIKDSIKLKKETSYLRDVYQPKLTVEVLLKLNTAGFSGSLSVFPVKTKLLLLSFSYSFILMRVL